MTLSLDRRRFLLTTAAAGAACLSPLATRVVAQAGPTKRRFVFLYLPGGWDQMLFLDPREYGFSPDRAEYDAEVARTGVDPAYMHRGYENETTDNYGNGLHRGVGDPDFFFGPSAVRIVGGEPSSAVNLPALAERVPMTIVRGINMGTLGHEPGLLYFLTGQPAIGSSARGVSMPIRLAAQLNDLDPQLGNTLLATIALGINSYTGDRAGRLAALKAQNVDDLQRILARDAALGRAPSVEEALATYASRPLGTIAQRYDQRGLLSAMRESAAGTRLMLENDLASAFRFLDENDDESRAIRDRYNIRGVDSSSGRRSAPVGAAFVAQAIKKDLAQFISVTLPAGGDTHGTGNRGHITGLYPAVDAIARLVDDLSDSPAPDALGGTWMDHTTICVFSEFSRTPLFNPTGGRDHHFTNSSLLIGAGIQPGRVIGRSTEVGMSPVTFDFANQSTLGDDDRGSGPDQRHITPADIGATLLASADLRYGEYRDGHPLWEALQTTPY